MTQFRIRSANQRTAEIAERSAELGIDRQFVSDLVEQFYGKIREDELLGPIFEREIKDNWSPHLQTMKNFWGSMALNEGSYHGRPMPAHMKLKDIHATHFERWLTLFEQTLQELTHNSECINFFLDRARRIGLNFQTAMRNRDELMQAQQVQQ